MAHGTLPAVMIAATHETDKASPQASRWDRLRLLAVPGAAAVLAMLGVVSVGPTALALWDMWQTDPLKSIGSLVPLVCLVLVLRAWRGLGWPKDHSRFAMAAGLLVLALTAVAVQLRERAVLELVLTRSWTISLPPPSLVAVLYAGGCVLCFGGWRLLRAASFPVCLMVLVNPVPHVFVRRVDLPLQYAAAHLARGFAQRAGAKLTPDQLRLMFTPEFGMFIAPGCNGMRGAIAMGLLALIAGHVFRLRLRWWAGTVLAGVLLGYVFNFVRLGVLVLYYLAALRVPWLQDRAETADYLLGGVLFFAAAVLLFSVISRKGRAAGPNGLNPVGSREVDGVFAGFGVRFALFAMLVGITAVPSVRAWQSGKDGAARQEVLPAAFPTRAGRFALRRTWEERLNGGVLLFRWAEYAAVKGGTVIAVGVSPTLGAHDTLLCHVAHGEDWLWHGDLRLAHGAGPGTNFSASLFNDGVTQTLEATTLCTASGCGQYTLGRRARGLIYSRPAAGLLAGDGARPIPVLLRAETTEVLLPAVAARVRLTGELQEFVAEMDPTLLGRSAR